MLFISLSRWGGTSVLTVNDLLDSAKNELGNLETGEIFLLRDLFKGYEWNRISHSDRLLLGTLFLNYIKTTDISVVAIEKLLPGSKNTKSYLVPYKGVLK